MCGFHNIFITTTTLGQNTRSGGDASMHGWRRDPQIFMRCKWRRGILSAAGKKVEEDIIIFIGGYINTLTHIVSSSGNNNVCIIKEDIIHMS